MMSSLFWSLLLFLDDDDDELNANFFLTFDTPQTQKTSFSIQKSF